MKKRIVTLLCVFALLLGFFGNFSIPATAAAAAGFQVGYARVDINPYVEEDNFNSGIMLLPLRGTGDVWNRLSTKGLVDDNGDGKVNREDGLAVTCIAVSDADGKTVLMITVDLIGGNLIEQARTEICARLEAAQASGELLDVVLQPDGIYYAGTHTHNAPDVTVYSANGKTGTNNDGVSLKEVNENLGTWIDRTVEDIGDAAIAALKDRATATVTRDQLSAKEATSDPVKGRAMNSVRHYVAEDKGCVAGDNFNNRGNDPKQVTQVNDNMYLLQFSFRDKTKLPIILTNWRGHPSMNNTDDEKKSGRNCISSDYPNAFRYNLEYNSTVGKDGTAVNSGKQVYRVAFFNGEGGNVNPRAREKVNGVAGYQWYTDLAATRKESRGNIYGRTLCAMAQECLATPENRQSVAYGSVRTSQYIFNSVRKTTGYSALAYEAGKAYQAEAATKTMSHPWCYTSPTTGETFVIGSRFHASNVISSSNWENRFQQPKGDLVDMELNVFMLGEELAFVTVPGEPFDYYYNEDGSNAWDNLLDDTYGRPFVFGYCNGAKGYIPNSRAYDYNLGSTKWQRGSYESSISPYEKGTGEKMVQLFGVMLDNLKSGVSSGYEGSCARCEGTVVWEAYNGKANLTTGHYYLLEDTMAPQIKIAPGANVCFDLNGYTVKGATRAFYTTSGGNSVLNLMDLSAEGDGAALGCGGVLGAAIGFGGGAILVDKNNTFNFYSGQLGVYEKEYCGTVRGGVMRNNGTVNMYGGTILGGKSATPEGVYVSGNTVKTASGNGLGATVHNSGTFNMYGGEIKAGMLERITGSATLIPGNINVYSEIRTPLEAKGACVFSAGKFKITGNAVVADLCIDDTKGKLFSVDNKTAPFTGSVQLSFYQDLDSLNAKFGTTTDTAALIEGTVTLANGMGFIQSGTNLTTALGAFYMTDSLGSGYYSTLRGAYAAYLNRNATDGVIRLMTDSGDDLTVTKDVCIDLNGFCATGSITVADGATLFGKDSQTDDYTVEDEFAYGKLSDVRCEGSGAVAGADSYLKVTEGAGISFHKVDLCISTMSLRPSAVGVYYSAPFAGDEVVAENVRSFGIVLSVESTDAAKQMLPGTFTAYTEFAPGEAGNRSASTLVKNIMRTGNTDAQNAANAEAVIYGCAYLQTDEGFVFGAPVAMSLRQQMELVDRQWRSLTEKQRDALLSLRFRYSDVLENWKIPNMLS